MIDFKNGSVFKLKKVKDAPNSFMELLIEGENVLGCYQALRDYVVFTDRRVVSVNVQGLTGSKKDFTTLPYSKIQAFSVETAGVFDLDSELDLFFSGIGKIRFEFTGASDIIAINKMIATHIL